MLSRPAPAHPQPSSLGVLAAALLMITAGFHSAGRADGIAVDWSDPVAWLTGSTPDLAVAGTLRYVGLAVCYWVLTSAFLYWLAGRRGVVPVWLRLMTAPIVRRAIDRSLAATLAASIALTPVSPAAAIEEEQSPVVFEVHDGVPVPHLKLHPAPPVGAANRPPDTPVSVVDASPVQAGVTVVGSAASRLHTVAVGENLWTIAARHLEVSNPGATAASVTAYWRNLIEANRDTLRSGDPNLIYPGEVLTIPPQGIEP